MNKTTKALLWIALASAMASTAASCASYLYHKNEARGGQAVYRKLAPFGFDTVLSPMAVLCDCLVEADYVTGRTETTTSVSYAAVPVNTLYLFLPAASVYWLAARRKGRRPKGQFTKRTAKYPA